MKISCGASATFWNHLLSTSAQRCWLAPCARHSHFDNPPWFGIIQDWSRLIVPHVRLLLGDIISSNHERDRRSYLAWKCGGSWFGVNPGLIFYIFSNYVNFIQKLFSVILHIGVRVVAQADGLRGFWVIELKFQIANLSFPAEMTKWWWW